MRKRVSGSRPSLRCEARERRCMQALALELAPETLSEAQGCPAPFQRPCLGMSRT